MIGAGQVTVGGFLHQFGFAFCFLSFLPLADGKGFEDARQISCLIEWRFPICFTPFALNLFWVLWVTRRVITNIRAIRALLPFCFWLSVMGWPLEVSGLVELVL